MPSGHDSNEYSAPLQARASLMTLAPSTMRPLFSTSPSDPERLCAVDPSIALHPQGKSAFCLALESKNLPLAMSLINPAFCDQACHPDGHTPLMLAIDAYAYELIEPLAPLSSPQRPFPITRCHFQGALSTPRMISAVGLSLRERHFKALELMAPFLDFFAPFEDADERQPVHGGKLLTHALIAAQQERSARHLISAPPRSLKIEPFLEAAREICSRAPLPLDCSQEFLEALGAQANAWASLLYPRADLSRASLSSGANALGMARGESPQWRDRLLKRMPLEALSHRDAKGRDALMISAARGDIDSLAALLPLSNPNHQDNAGDTALMIALKERSDDCAQALSIACSPTIKNKAGLTAFLIAAETGAQDAILRLAPLSDMSEIDGRGFDMVDLLLSPRGPGGSWPLFKRVIELLPESSFNAINANGDSIEIRALRCFERLGNAQEISAFFLARRESQELNGALALPIPKNSAPARL